MCGDDDGGIGLRWSGKINTAGASVNTASRPVNTAGSKPTVNHPRLISNAFKRGHSLDTRPFNKYLANKNSVFNKKVNTVRVNDSTARHKAVLSENKGKGANVDNPQQKEYKEKGVIDSGCSRHMTGNKCYLTEYEDYDGGFVSFGDGKGGILGKGKIKTGTLDFDDVCFCKELKYNLFSVSQMCDKKNNVLFTDTECIVLSSDFKLLDESQVMLRVPRKDNIYSVDLKSVVPTGGLTCLVAKATIDESNLWHRRLGHINYKTLNKLVRGNLARGLPSKIFKNDHSCVACQKEKQHKASYKAKLVNSISKPLHMLHMDLFGPTNVKSLMKKNRNQLDQKVKVIRCENGTEFKNSVMNQFCEMKGIKRGNSVLRTLDRIGVDENEENKNTVRGAGCAYGRMNMLMRVFNKRTKIVEETLNIRFLENAPNVKGNGPDWIFDVDSLTISMNYVPVVAGNQTNVLMDSEEDTRMKPTEVDESGVSDKDGQDAQDARSESERQIQKEMQTEDTNRINIVGTPVNTAGPSFDNVVPAPPVNTAGPSVSTVNAFQTPMDDSGIFDGAYDDGVGAEADLNNLETTMHVSPIPHGTNIPKVHPLEQLLEI
ncbi:putative ribonuclease H-like domain-containing protein [Tanacetum coccineum]|uniref:Ribonuclease H-like domain-containing protein n=1 Tax=Tanacetum coccineum TaxID=301880 RepID=A0ABQ5HQF5_9ASTR